MSHHERYFYERDPYTGWDTWLILAALVVPIIFWISIGVGIGWLIFAS